MKLVMVAGVARSGTSLAMGVLAQLGIPIPGRQNDNSGNALKFNPWGSFESRRFDFFIHEGNQKLRPHTKKGLAPPDQVLKEFRAKYDPQLRTTMQKMKSEVKDKSLGWWAFKANGNAALDLLLPHVDHLVLITRSLVDNAKSYQVMVEHSAKLRKQNAQIQLEKSLMECSMSQNSLVQTAWRYPNLPKTFVSFERLRQHPAEHADLICHDLNIALDEDKRQKVVDFVKGDFSTWKDKGYKAEYGN